MNLRTLEQQVIVGLGVGRGEVVGGEDPVSGANN